MAVHTIGVIGAGTMGSGIAQVAAMNHFDVILIDISEAAVREGVDAVASHLARTVAKGKMSVSEQEAALRRIHGTTTYTALKSADVIIEAATENYDLRANILKQIDSLVETATIISSNTSSVSITKLASVISHPERFVGLHFFNPVPVMALVEIVRGLQTSDATHDTIAALASQLSKSPITVKSGPGFVVNRILLPMIQRTIFLLAEGSASAKDIDEGMKLGCNHPIGPLALADLIGLDVLLAVMQTLHDEFSDSKY
jgi:3-hydroxybutyryl-CoA dehydrogenase